MKVIRHLCFILSIILWGLVPALHAQVAPDNDTAHWETLAERAETAVDLRQGSDAVFETLRASVAEYRKTFDEARGEDSQRIATLRGQIDALGAVPEGDTAEAEDVAAKRKELDAQLSKLLVPVQKAESDFLRADALVRQIDRILRERQADELLLVTPTPLNPAYWQPALKDIVTSSDIIWKEPSHNGDAQTWKEFLQTLPLVVFLSALGCLLLLRGRRWAGHIVQSMTRFGVRGIGIWRFLVSLLRIILPLSGLVLLGLALVSSGLFGPKGNSIILTLPVLCGLMLGVRWVAERVFSRDDEEALLLVPPAKRRQARFYVNLITVVVVGLELVTLLLDAGYPSETSKSVVSFPFLIVTCFALFNIGLILRGYTDEPSEEVASPDLRTSTLSRVIRILGSGAVLVACVSPILLAAGYFNAVEALLQPYIMSLVILGLVMALQRFAADVYGGITGQGTEARDALMPVLFGIILLLAVAPALALIWGARVTDLTELWSAFERGFAIGDSRISPTDFIAFAAIFVIGYTLTRLTQSALRTNVLPKTRIDIGGQNAIVSGIGYVGIFLAAIAAITGAGIDLSSLAIVAGALSVGIGFGLQNIVSNFVSGIILLIERPISEGDWIEVGGQMGYVRAISVRSTRIETFDRTDVIVPNADLVSGTVTNYTRGNTIGRVIVPVGVAYGNDTRRIEQILREIAEAQPMVLTNPAPSVLFVNFGADALEFEIRCLLRDVNWMLGVKSDINHAVAERFAAEGIEIPYAQRDIWLRNPEVLMGGGTAAAVPQPPAEDPQA